MHNIESQLEKEKSRLAKDVRKKDLIDLLFIICYILKYWNFLQRINQVHEF